MESRSRRTYSTIVLHRTGPLKTQRVASTSKFNRTERIRTQNSIYTKAQGRPQKAESQKKLFKDPEVSNETFRVLTETIAEESRQAKETDLKVMLSRDIYWASMHKPTRVITGVKQQYERVKDELRKKTEQCQAAQRDQSHLIAREKTVQYEVLLNQYQRLKAFLQEHLTVGTQIQQSMSQLGYEGNQFKQFVRGLSAIIAELRINNNQLQRQLEEIKQGSLRRDQQYSEQTEKLAILDRQIISKDNNIRVLTKQLRCTSQNLNKATQKVSSLEDIIVTRETQYRRKLNVIKETEQARFESERKIFAKAMEDKLRIIERLTSENQYLETLFGYCCPPKEVEREPKLNSKLDVPVTQNNRSRGLSNSSLHILKSGGEKSQEDDSVCMTVSYQQFSQLKLQQNHQNRLRCKRVRHEQVKPIGELLRYRLIAANIDLERAKKYFELQGISPSETGRKQINYLQIKGIIRLYPFLLSEEQAHLVARFFTEDNKNQSILFDEQTEVSCTMAKSILRALVGDYKLPDLHSVHEKWNHISTKYGHNLWLALNSIAPKHEIAKDALLNIMRSLDIPIDAQMEAWMIGYLVAHSQHGLDRLAYPQIFGSKDPTAFQSPV